MQRITTPDGCTIQVHDGGDPKGLPVIVHHGTPGATRRMPEVHAWLLARLQA